MQRIIINVILLIILPYTMRSQTVIDSFFVDTRNSSPISSSILLNAGTEYWIEIDGSFSLWTNHWLAGICNGIPDSIPKYPSLGVTNGLVGVDPEFVFAVPNGSSLCSLTLPYRSEGSETVIEIKLDDISGWINPVPYDTTYNPDHQYQYHLTGQNDLLQIRVVDLPINDNYGMLRIKVISSLTPINNKNSHLTDKFQLHQNYPNPFNPATTIEYALPKAEKVHLTVFNMLGQQVATLVNGEQMQPGVHSATFDAADLPSGVYYYRLTAGAFSETKKMLLVR